MPSTSAETATTASPQTTERLLRLDDEAAADPALAGHKAATLARLRRAGHRVPPGVVLPASIADAVRGRPTAEALPATVSAALEAALAELGGVVAVRSSGLAEDLPDASWAGQYESVLGVRTPAELWAAIDACVASAAGARARAYGQDLGAAPSSLAVLVQRQVAAEAAGVAFTANPVTGDDEVLVSAVRGLGDRLAGGEVTPEEWVQRPGAAPQRRGGPEPVLGAEDAARIAREAVRLATAIGAPADVEWALAGGELHVLQARPITALPVEPTFELPAEGTWEKDTSHYTDLITPIGASLYFAPLDGAIGEMARTYGLLIDGAESRCLGGEMYMRILPPGGKDGPAPPWWLMGLLVRLVPALRAKLRAARRALAEDLPRRMLERWPTELRPELEARIAELRAVDLTALDDAGLRAHLERVCTLTADGQRIHFLLFIPYLMALRDLVTLAAERLGWEEPEALELVGGLSGTSSAPARDLRALAGLAQGEPAVRELLAGWAGQPLAEVLAALRARPGNQAERVAAGLEAHLERFGCRVTGYDPGQPSMAERPDLMLGILRDLVREGASPDALEVALARRRAEADARLAAALAERGAGEAERARFLAAVEHARAAWPVREDNLFYTDSMPSGLLRLVVLEVGRRLLAAGALHRAEDACWLEGEELFAVLDGHRGTLAELAPRVARRRAEQAWVAAHPGPTIIGPPPQPPPDLRAMPEAIQRTTGAILWAIAHEYPGERRAGEGLRGAAGAPGRYTGTVRIVRSDAEFASVQAGEVLVCPITTPVWSVLFGRIGALVTDAGGLLSHAAIVAREHNVPAVLGTVEATTRLRDGQLVTVDGTAGTVEVHDAPPGEGPAATP